VIIDAYWTPTKFYIKYFKSNNRLNHYSFRGFFSSSSVFIFKPPDDLYEKSRPSDGYRCYPESAAFFLGFASLVCYAHEGCRCERNQRINSKITPGMCLTLFYYDLFNSMFTI